MKRILFLLLAFCTLLPLAAQQQTGDPRTRSIFAFPEFKDAKILQPFGRYTRAKANVLLKKSTLCFMKNDTVMEAYVQNVLGVEFDSVKYMKINDKQMGKILSQKGYNILLSVTTINESKLRAETEGTDNLPFLDFNDVGLFMELHGDDFEYDRGYPLTTQYYFSIMGTLIPANESNIKKYVRPEMKKAFKRLMGDKYWSWKDPKSLEQLFTYFPEK